MEIRALGFADTVALRYRSSSDKHQCRRMGPPRQMFSSPASFGSGIGSFGHVVYEERLKPASGTVYASDVLADGKLYFVSREEGTYVLQSGPEFDQLARNTIGSHKTIFNTTLATSRGQLLLRSRKYLYCIGAR